MNIKLKNIFDRNLSNNQISTIPTEIENLELLLKL